MSPSPAALATKPASEPIPGYKLVKRIGAGGYGEVWTAELPGGLVKAIKFVYGLLDEDRAAREQKALNRIKGVRHPFLLSLERIEVVDGQLLIVTELADCSLKDRFEEFKKKNLPGIPRDELLAFMRDTADALDYMSEQHSLQHLDVKPENLLLVGGRIKVADFGLVKDIHDAAVSMMGGLTPIYAPPEVFEGRPSRRSDQYSLAIVYQEMLTGVLPFPGRTAAQLAAQHLNAKPQLEMLPENDQEVIARALAKKPPDRFQSCGELVTALVEAGRRSPGEPAQVAGAAGAQELGTAVTATRLPAEMLANLDATQAAIQRLAEGGVDQLGPTVTRIPRLRATQARESVPVADAAPENDRRAPDLDALQNVPPLLDVPPPEFDVTAPPFRPTLFIGLGGCGGKVLRRLRRHLDDRLIDVFKPLVPMLLLDTDTRELASAAHGDELGNLQPEETLALPLRRSQDYKEDSRRILEWLSRRWLFNIPRSLQTEGLRPLGRLALVDHAQAVTARLKPAIEKLYQDATRAQLFPRVVIVASPCGGTGGGMVTDVALLARQIAETLPQGTKMEVLATLVHGTNRNLQQQDLAGANTVATLTELAQFHRPGVPFPGDPACGLAPRAEGSGPLDAVYLFHTGEEMSADEIEAACNQVAEFLMLDTVTQAGNVLEACRLEIGETPGLRLRSFGLHQFGFAHDKLLDDSVARICRGLVQRLSGPQPAAEAKKPSLLFSGGDVRSSDQPPADPLADLDQRTATLVRTMGLDVDPLLAVVEQFATTDLGGDPEAFFKKLMLMGPSGEPLIDKWLAAADLLFGRADPVSIKPQPGELSLALDERVRPWIPQVGSGLREWIEAIVEDRHCRVVGAKRAAKWLQSYLRALTDKFNEAKKRFVADVVAPLQVLATPDLGKKGKRPLQELANAFLTYCKLRLLELAAQRGGQIAHALQSHVVVAHDMTIDLQRDLDQLAAQFPVSGEPDNRPVLTAKTKTVDVRSSVTHELRAAEESLVLQVEEQFIKDVFKAPGGMRAVITAGGQAREKLLTTIRTAARHAALTKVTSIDLSSVLVADEKGESPIAKCLEQAQPWLQRCGGRRRLVFVVPQPLAAQYSPTQLVSQLPGGTFTQPPAVAPGSSSDLAVLFELGDISVPHAAAHLICFRRDLAEAASRLQTRSDITWTPVFTF